MLHSEAVVERSEPATALERKDILIIFTKFTGKHMCQGFFFNKVADLRTATLLKKRLWDRSVSL